MGKGPAKQNVPTFTRRLMCGHGGRTRNRWGKSLTSRPCGAWDVCICVANGHRQLIVFSGLTDRSRQQRQCRFPLIPPFPVHLQVGKMGRIQPAQKPITTDLLSRRIPANRQAARMLAVHPAFQRMRQYRSIHHENAPQGTRLGRSLCGHLHSPPNTLSSSPDRFAADFVHPGGGDVRQSRSSGLVDQTWPEGRDRPPAGS